MGCNCSKNKTVLETEKYKLAQVDESIKQIESATAMKASQLGNAAQPAYGVLDVLKDKVTGNLEYAPDELKEKRLQVCRRCPSLIKLPLGINGTGNCGKCSCFVDLKTSYKLSQCPDSKW